MATRQKKVSFNCDLPENYVKDVRRDAERFNKPVEGIALAIFRNFFLMRVEDRAKCYTNIPSKKMGRKVKI